MSCIQQLVNSSDVVHVFQLAMPSSWLPALFAHSTSFAQRRRVFFDWDDLWGDNGILVDQGRVANIVASFMEERFLSLADGVSVASEFLSRRATSAGARRVFYIPNGTENDSASKQSKLDARKALGITNLGVILCHVGFADFTNVWNRIRSAYPRVTLIIIGQPPRYNMRRITKTNDPQIIYTGRIDSTKVKSYLSASDILLLKTNNEFSEQARFPIRLGDYLSAERPIVAGDIGEIGRVMRQSGCGLLSKPGDDADFANRIIELIGSPRMWDEMGAKAQQMAERLSWVHLASQLEEAYESA
jgi:glycosyltransferase involved in cell wall biosynthesis